MYNTNVICINTSTPTQLIIEAWLVNMATDCGTSRALFCWGFGKYGQLGTGDNLTKELPQVVTVFKDDPRIVTCGGHYTLVAIETRGGSSTRLHSCGRGLYGRLGNGSETDQNILKPLANLHKDKRNVKVDTVFPVSISAGHWHGCLVTNSGELYSWGYNKAHGVLGVSMLPEVVSVPTHVSVKVNFSSVSCGFNYTIAISHEGILYSWGCGRHGVLGHGDREDRLVPTLIKSTSSVVMSKVHSGYCHAGFISREGQLYTCGKGSDGALGHGVDKRDRLEPCLVENLLEYRVTDVSCSQGEHHLHTLMATDEGHVYSCGDGYKCKLGHGDDKSRDTPIRIDPVHFKGWSITSVACGGIHSAALASGEGVFTWGCGSDGRLGHPEAHGHRYLFLSNVPRLVEGLGDWKPFAVSCSYYHTAALCYK